MITKTVMHSLTRNRDLAAQGPLSRRCPLTHATPPLTRETRLALDSPQNATLTHLWLNQSTRARTVTSVTTAAWPGATGGRGAVSLARWNTTWSPRVQQCGDAIGCGKSKNKFRSDEIPMKFALQVTLLDNSGLSPRGRSAIAKYLRHNRE